MEEYVSYELQRELKKKLAIVVQDEKTPLIDYFEYICHCYRILGNGVLPLSIAIDKFKETVAGTF